MNNISRLKRSHEFINDKIKISFNTGSVSDSFSVYLKDEKGKWIHVYWYITPDRCHQNFSKISESERLKLFIQGVIDSWVKEEDDYEREVRQLREKREKEEEERIKNLVNNFDL